MDNKRPLIAHLCLFCSGAFWGLMAPVGKDAMLHGIDGIDLVSFRVLGGPPLLDSIILHQKRTYPYQGHHQDGRCSAYSDWYATNAAIPSV